MKALALISAALLAPVAPALAQGDALPPPGSAPRAVAIFASLQGYDDLTADRFGTPAAPAPHELGLVMISRMFRNTCLGLERGAALVDVMPPGFTAYEDLAYLMGTAPTGEPGAMLLSPTGDIDLDAAMGHPTLRIAPSPRGMTCRIEWQQVAPPATDRQAGMAGFLVHWLPYEFAMVRATPSRAMDAQLLDYLEWDRPCADKWCPVTLNYALERGFLNLETRLNITDIEGARP